MDILAERIDPARWRDIAACLEEDPELFYPVFEGEREPLEREALLVCGVCPVTALCLRDELRHGEVHQFGTRGGMSEDARRALLRRARRTAGRTALPTVVPVAAAPVAEDAALEDRVEVAA